MVYTSPHNTTEQHSNPQCKIVSIFTKRSVDAYHEFLSAPPMALFSAAIQKYGFCYSATYPDFAWTTSHEFKLGYMSILVRSCISATSSIFWEIKDNKSNRILYCGLSVPDVIVAIKNCGIRIKPAQKKDKKNE